jgi:DTW domain-containing protein YfiP
MSSGLEGIVHHEMEQAAYLGSTAAWESSVQVTRCGKCWLRQSFCYCETFREKASKYSEGGRISKVLLYYHFKEIGRTANTGHIFEAMAPHWCTSMTLGDLEAERNLLRTIMEEQDR